MALLQTNTSKLLSQKTSSLAARVRQDADKQNQAEKLFHLGLEHEREGRPEQAYAAFSHGHELWPEHIGLNYVLGVVYDEGRGIKPDWSKARSYYKNAAGQGHAPSAFLLALLLAHGQGGAVNHTEAASWYRLAAETGIEHAEYALGGAYMHGLGVIQDDKEASIWLKRAMDHGHLNAQALLGLLHMRGVALDAQPDEGMFLLISAALQGDEFAMRFFEA